MKVCESCGSTYPSEFTVCPKDKSVLQALVDLQPGMMIRDKYQILERIGVGGMATVYKAKHLTFNEVRAIKVVSTGLMSDPDFLNRFKKEAIITRRLRHANAVQLDDFDVMEDGRPFIVMEHVQGRNLRSLIHDQGPLAVSRALNLAGQVASALAAAHKLGIVHRDIKPDNILVIAPAARAAGGGGADLVKVLDFGIAKIRDGYESVSGGSATQAGMVVGTPQYVSPEQASGKIGDQIDGRSDLYSLGVVLYEMLTCRLPFKSETAVGYLVHHMHTAPTPPNAIRPDVRLPDPVAALLMKALEKDRNKRFQTADEMIAALSNPQMQMRGAGFAASNGPTGVAPARSAAAGAALSSPAGSRPAAPGAGAATVVSPQRAPARAQNSASARPGNREGAAAAVALAPASSQAPGIAMEGTVFDETLKIRKPSLGISPENVSRKQVGIAAAVVIVLVLAGMMLHHSSPARVATVGVSTEDEARILQDVKESFAGSDALRRDPIVPSVHGAVVTLSGKVRRSYESEIAQSLAANVDGVREVKNKLEVVEAPEQREQVWRSEKNEPPPVSAFARRQAQREATWGRRRMALRDLVGAEAAFRRALQADPSNADALQGLQNVQQAGKGTSGH